MASHPHRVLVKSPNFKRFLQSQIVAEVGSRITREGLPVVAILIASANAPQLGLLAALSILPALLLGNAFGGLADRYSRQRLLVLGNVGRGCVLLLIPLLYILHHLTFWFIAIVTGTSAALSILMAISRHALLPSLVSSQHLPEANDLLGSAESLGETVGPGVMGLLIVLVGAPLTILFDAGANFISAVLLRGVKDGDTRSPQLAPNPEQVSQWLPKTLKHPILQKLAFGQSLRATASGFFATLYELYVLKTLHFSPFFLGLLITSGGVGSLLASRWLHRLRRRISMGSLIWWGAAAAALLNLAVPLAKGPLALAFSLLWVAQFGGDFFATASEITQVTIEQQVTPNHLLGRVNGTLRALTGGSEALGALLAGPLSVMLSLRFTLYVADGLLLLGALCYLFPDLRQYQSGSEEFFWDNI